MIDDAALRSARSDDSFGESAWLTFYLHGQSSDHNAMRSALEDLGARNLEGAEGGFVYAKVPTTMERNVIVDAMTKVRTLAKQNDVDVVIIDLDSSDDVSKSKHHTLWQN